MKFTHLMIDLETMGITPGSAIVQIGLCAFCLDDETMQSKSIRVSLQDCLDHGLTVDAATILWWFRQDEDAR